MSNRELEEKGGADYSQYFFEHLLFILLLLIIDTSTAHLCAIIVHCHLLLLLPSSQSEEPPGRSAPAGDAFWLLPLKQWGWLRWPLGACGYRMSPVDFVCAQQHLAIWHRATVGAHVCLGFSMEASCFSCPDVTFSTGFSTGLSPFGKLLHSTFPTHTFTLLAGCYWALFLLAYLWSPFSSTGTDGDFMMYAFREKTLLDFY